jgi:hypothetical protein
LEYWNFGILGDEIILRILEARVDKTLLISFQLSGENPPTPKDLIIDG